MILYPDIAQRDIVYVTLIYRHKAHPVDIHQGKAVRILYGVPLLTACAAMLRFTCLDQLRNYIEINRLTDIKRVISPDIATHCPHRHNGAK